MDLLKQDLQGVLSIVHDCLDIHDANNMKSVMDKLSELVPFQAAVLCGMQQSHTQGNVFFSDIVNHSYSNEWGETYFENDFIDVDPVIHYSQNSTKAFTWESAFQNLSAHNLRIKEFLTMAGDFHLQDGIAHLVNEDDKGTLISLAIDSPHNKYYSVLVNHITPHLHEAFTRLQQPDTHKTYEFPDLTEREREVLKWTSEGKSSWEIGMILSISERTVKYHINNIKTKLNAVNRAHAVAKALRSDLIS